MFINFSNFINLYSYILTRLSAHLCVFSGQNLYTSTVQNNNQQIDIERAMLAWFEEEKIHYDYNADTCTTGQQCGHYTQV